MSWEEKASTALRNYFAHKTFTAAEAAAVLSDRYHTGTTYRILSDLSRKGAVTKMGRGLYRAEPNDKAAERPTAHLAPELETMRKLLSDGGLEFMITGYAVLGPFIHLLPRRVIDLIYVKAGGGERAAEILEKARFKVLLNPRSEREVSSALGLVNGDLVVVRERRELYGANSGGVAAVERAIVDLYFESTRARIPFSEVEVGRIVRNMVAHGGVDLAKITKIASRRGVDAEIRALLRAEGNLPPNHGKLVTNEHVRAVMADVER